jgi:alpha-methylacyl-CoA racemase
VSGPLSGLRIIEAGGIGPAPFAAMLLADNGAEVIRVERPDAEIDSGNALIRSRKIISLDLKRSGDVDAFREICRTADAVIEGFRPGLMERLGLGPDTLLGDNPRLVYGRVTGWGQTGPYAPWAGHDLNYIALSGALHAVGPAERPMPPLALAGDFGGGGMLLAFGVTAAMLAAQRTGRGDIVDCSMAEGAGLLMSAFHYLHSRGKWEDKRESNIADGGSHYYNVYETSDEKFICIAAMEQKFYAELLGKLGLNEDEEFAQQENTSLWPRLKWRLAKIFRSRTRDQWCDLLEYSDTCFAPVMSLAEAPRHVQALARGSFVQLDGVAQPAPSPRYAFSPLDAPWAAEVMDVEDIRISSDT